jgi:hypothetical protein
MMRRLVVGVLLIVSSGAYAQRSTVVSYSSFSQYGRDNLDSVTAGLRRLGVPYDSIDRSTRISDTIDYRRSCAVIWSSGDPQGETSESAFSEKDVVALQRYLESGTAGSKRSLIIAGQNIARKMSALPPNLIDTFFLHSVLHVHYLVNAPVAGLFDSQINGAQPTHWKFPEMIIANEPDVIAPADSTPRVGPTVNSYAYFYSKHHPILKDSGAGVSYYDPRVNITFYGFDWSNLTQTTPSEAGYLTSGTTRALSAALAFVTSHAQTLCALGAESAREFEPRIDLFPNPITSNQLDMKLTLSEPAEVSAKIVNEEGIPLRYYDEGHLEAGPNTFLLDLEGIASGNYFLDVLICDRSKVRVTQKIQKK